MTKIADFKNMLAARVSSFDALCGSVSAFAYVLACALAWFILLGLASAASAQNLEPVQVYATATSNDTGPGGPLWIGELPAGETQVVYLWAAGGSEDSVGTPCTEDGSGSPICGISFALDVTGGYQMLDFQANPQFDGSAARLPFRIMLATSDHLVGNAFDLGEPDPQNRYLGVLALGTTNVNGDSEIVVSGSAIGADLTMREITSEPIVVPEPGVATALAFGVLGLLGSGSRRAGRSD